MSKEEVKVKEVHPPSEYFYEPEAKITIPAHLFTALNSTLEQAISEEITEYFPQQTRFEDAEGKEVKNPSKKQLEEGKVFEVFDVEGTLSQREPKVYFTEMGRQLMRLRMDLLYVHHQNIQSGVAKHKSERTLKKV